MVCAEIECANAAYLLFNEYDGDDDELMSMYEFTDFYEYHCKNNEKSVEQLISEYDLDQDGKFNLDEFTELYCNECNKPDETPECFADALAIFEQYDSNTDAQLPKTEFAIVYYLHL